MNAVHKNLENKTDLIFMIIKDDGLTSNIKKERNQDSIFKWLAKTN